jgi:cytochrome c oxidase accessory protein FixG
MKNKNELHEDRLATTTDDGERVYLYPEEVKGKWDTRRSILYSFLIVLYIVLPWLKINGNQAILLHIQKREFFILGGHFYAHNIPLLFIVILTFILGIGLLTALKGRVWCGWACPQTVFIEEVFRKIEYLIEGNYRKRKKLDEMGFSFEKIWKKTLKWSIFTIASLIISHSFVAYFVPVEEFVHIVGTNPNLHSTLFTVIMIVTGIVLLDFGWFREQFCIIACPYGRIQSVIMDKDTTVVAYDYNRGEPRKQPKQDPSEQGDCINCYKCVHVCPTGIDIRRGTQMECINCTKCIDICDEVMTKVKKPTGLIRFTTERQIEEGSTKVLRPRVIAYSVVLFFLVAIGGYLIDASKQLDVIWLRGTKAPFQVVVTDGQEKIVNHYKAEILYRGDKEMKLDFQIDNKNIEVVSPMSNRKITEKRKTILHIFFKFKRDALVEGKKPIKVKVVNVADPEKPILKEKELVLLGPLK